MLLVYTRVLLVFSIAAFVQQRVEILVLELEYYSLYFVGMVRAYSWADRVSELALWP